MKERHTGAALAFGYGLTAAVVLIPAFFFGLAFGWAQGMILGGFILALVLVVDRVGQARRIRPDGEEPQVTEDKWFRFTRL
ncbi:MAG: hypothetical protein HKN91_12555 [Acidimicrobiia bacterium]|nr:hypothetical protein [Acidimicrobiia bacterium]